MTFTVKTTWRPRSLRGSLSMGALAGSLLTCLATGAGAAGNELERGKYLAAIMDCAGCHTGGAMIGKPDPARFLAGSEIGFELPGLGVFYPPNLTSDKETGLGNWTVEDIIAAVTKGQRPDGRELAPIMPWPSYQALTEADALALATYIKALPPVSFEAPGPFGAAERPTAPYLTAKMPE